MFANETIDYAEVGLIAGLEVHQQLLTERKMFCHCPAGLYTKDHDGAVLRHMRPTLSELGEYDGTALMEFKTRKNIIYLLHQNNVCTYEMDDTPPFLVNQQALDVAIEQCLMLGCDIVDEVHIARKQYLDGSIPTGFQRTAIVGVNGELPFRGGAAAITQVSVEEDSCREVSDSGHLIVWRTDRLGMPLIETVTGPDLRTPEEVEEAILLIGRVCRSTGHVRVGHGRQPPGRQRLGARGTPGGDQGRAPGGLGAAAGARRGGAAGQPARAARRAAPARLLEARGRADRRTSTSPTSSPTRSCEILRQESWERFVEEERTPAGIRAAARGHSACGRCGCRAWPARCAGRPSPITPSPTSWPAGCGSSPAWTSSRSCCTARSGPTTWARGRSCGACASRLGCGRRRRAGRGLGRRAGHPHRRRRDPAALRRRPRRRAQRDPAALRRRQHRLRAHPARARIACTPTPTARRTRMTRERVERLAAQPARRRPGSARSATRRSACPLDTIHFLIRRGGAAPGGPGGRPRPARTCGAPASSSASGSRGCAAPGSRWTGSPGERWCELFAPAAASGQCSVEAWKRIVAPMAAMPDRAVAQIVEEAGAGGPRATGTSRSDEAVAVRTCTSDRSGQRIRYCMGQRSAPAGSGPGSQVRTRGAELRDDPGRTIVRRSRRRAMEAADER